MKKVMVIGSGGAGKSTFSRRLGEATGLPIIHLDAHFWRPNWDPTPKDEWKAKVEELVRGDAWIMDGNFGSNTGIENASRRHDNHAGSPSPSLYVSRYQTCDHVSR